MSSIIAVGCFLALAKVLVFITGQESVFLDGLCVIMGLLVVGFSVLQLLFQKSGSRGREDFHPFATFLIGLFAIGISSVSSGNKDSPFLLLRGSEEVKTGILFRYPGKEVFHYSHNPIKGELPLETRVLREDVSRELKSRPILIKVNTMLSYNRGSHNEQEHFPELWEFNDVIRDALISAQEKIPAGKEYDAYEGKELRRIFLDSFRLSTTRDGFIGSNLGYDLKMKIISISAEPIENYPKGDRWSHGSFPVSNVAKDLEPVED